MSYRCTERLEKDKLIRRVKPTWVDSPDWFYLYDAKRPDQIQHRLGKAWIYVAWNLKALASEGNQRLVYFKTEETQFSPIPDAYAVFEHRIYGKIFCFSEFQVTESGNGWKKDYRALFESFAEDQLLSLMVVTTGDYSGIKAILVKQMRGLRNVRLEFYTEETLRHYCWKIALQLREKYRRKELIPYAEPCTNRH